MHKRLVIGDFPEHICSTYGNYLRRMFMHCDYGYTPIGMRINDGEVGTIFETVDNLVEDLVNVYTNLQDLVYTVEGNEEIVILTASATNGVLTSESLAGSGVTIKPDTEILHTVGGLELKLEVVLRRSRGFHSQEENEDFLNERSLIKFIPFSSKHSSLDRVWFTDKAVNQYIRTLALEVRTKTENGEEVVRNILEEIERRNKELMHTVQAGMLD